MDGWGLIGKGKRTGDIPNDDIGEKLVNVARGMKIYKLGDPKRVGGDVGRKIQIGQRFFRLNTRYTLPLKGTGSLSISKSYQGRKVRLSMDTHLQ